MRLNFTQHKTSTVDDSTGECGLLGVECLSPIQGNDFQGSITHDFSDSSLSVSDENTCPELGSSGSQTTFGAEATTYVTPISSLISKTRFKVSQTLSSSAEVRDSVSTPGDSGFTPLPGISWKIPFLTKRALCKKNCFRRGPPRMGDLVKNPKHPGRLRRLSTLREQGSQSETEDEKQMVTPNSEARVGAASVTSERQQGSSEKMRDWTVRTYQIPQPPVSS